jgi:hypothetical protein
MSAEAIETWIIAGVVSLVLIVVGGWIGIERAMRLGRPYDAGKPIGTRVAPEAHSTEG